MHLPSFPPPGFPLHASHKPTANLKLRTSAIFGCFLLVLLATTLLSVSLESQEKASLPSLSNRLAADTIALTSTLLNINNISMWVRSDGVTSRNPNGTGYGLRYPRGTGGLMYMDGLFWIGKVNDGTMPSLRMGGVGNYEVGTVPGPIITGSPLTQGTVPNRIYRIRRDYKTADLTTDAAEFFDVPKSSVTPEQIGQIRQQYEKDWNEWPWEFGAPFHDANGNGKMDGDDYPDYLGADQVVWFAYNDLDRTTMSAFFEQVPIGIEVQATMWAYHGTPELEDVVYKRYRLIYKGKPDTPPGSIIDSMFVSQWADPDIGNSGDDLGGCDSALSLGFEYNATTSDAMFLPFFIYTPALGFTVVQGPAVPGAPTDTALFDFQVRTGYKRLPMTSFLLKGSGSAIGEPSDAGLLKYAWNVVRGYWPLAEKRPLYNPDRSPTKFPFAGNLLTGTGWIDSDRTHSGWYDWGGGLALFNYSSPGSRRFWVNSGPFSMALGDTQDVVIAVVAGIGEDSPHSVEAVKNRAYAAAAVYPYLIDYVGTVTPSSTPSAKSERLPSDYRLAQNYPNPFNPETRIRYELPVNAYVQLSIYDLLGREVIRLEDGAKSAGSYSVVWDGRNRSHQPVPSGIYIYRMTAGHIQISKKMLLVR